MCVKREPCVIIDRRSKVDSIGNLNQKLFIDFFIQEVALRERRGRSQPIGPTIESKYAKMLTRMADIIWGASMQLQVNCANLTFIFLNRYYAFFVKKNPLTKMTFFWDDFIISLRSDPGLLGLLNYDDSQRELVCNIIQEIRETKEIPAFKKFVQDHLSGYKIVLPEHDKERSALFETVLTMLKQITENEYYYFKQNHASEIIKAHTLSLQKFGNPIKLQLGHFIGSTAMHRLKQYLEWVSKGKNFGGLMGEEF